MASIVDLCLEIQTGQPVVLNPCGYQMYSALKRILQDNCSNPCWQDFDCRDRIARLNGPRVGAGKIALDRRSNLRIRCDMERAQLYYRVFQNKKIIIADSPAIRLVRPQIQLIEPAETLAAYMVTVKQRNFSQKGGEAYFLDSCRLALEKIGVSGQVAITRDRDDRPSRRIIQVAAKIIVGYGVVVRGLSSEDSITLQENGVGGRGRFGCGFFYPVRESR